MGTMVSLPSPRTNISEPRGSPEANGMKVGLKPGRWNVRKYKGVKERRWSGK